MKYITLRPSKSALYRKIWKQSKNINGKYGVDAAAANFVNKDRLFRTEQYIGLDLQEKLLRKGLKNNPDDIGIVCNLITVQLPESFADLVISSNTLSYLVTLEDRLAAVKNISKCTSSSGICAIEMQNDDITGKIKEFLSSEFEIVNDYYYGNCISMFFEKFVDFNNPKTGLIWRARKRLIRCCSALLSLFETGKKSDAKTRHTLFICKNRKNISDGTHEFTPANNFAKIETNLYKQIQQG